MAASLIDSSYFGDTFADPAMRHVFSDEARFRAWLDVEAALARTQARLGLIPISAAEEISREAVTERLDLTAMTAEDERVGFPILPLVHQLAKACDPETARWIHWGATTQDIVDTGLVLQMRDSFAVIEGQLGAVNDALAHLAHDADVHLSL
jgi:3-carboxy-cis,cis-muconate cycloisomerase